MSLTPTFIHGMDVTIVNNQIKISKGYIVDGDIQYESSNDTVLSVNPSNGSYRLDYVIASPCGCNIKDICFSIISSNSLVPSNSLIPSNSYFLGFILVDPNFGSINNLIYYRSVNKDLDSDVLYTTPEFYYQNIKKSLEEWNTSTLYFEDQIVEYNGSLYKALKTHGSTSSTFNQDYANNCWLLLTNKSAVGPQGPIGIQGSISGTGVQGMQGPQGLQGLTGINGIDATGSQGPQGPIGLTGINGISGMQGPQGLQGLTGINGIDATGSQGPQGPIGVQGSISGTGVQGPQGLIGINGTQGPVGVQGSNGVQGKVGAQGLQGQGSQGSQGPIGLTGSNGNIGPQGLQGLQGLVGPQGLTGSNGVQGKIGAQGIMGNPGIQGPTGALGMQGPQGLIGVTGAGVQGPEGPQASVDCNSLIACLNGDRIINLLLTAGYISFNNTTGQYIWQTGAKFHPM